MNYPRNILFLLLFSVFFLKCKTQNNIASAQFFRTGEVEHLLSTDGTIKLLSNYKSMSIIQASEFAERNALENLLFKGVPGSNQEKPLILSEEEALRNHPNTLSNLILKYDYQRFLIESYPDFSTYQNGLYSVAQVITFDVNALRKFLEKENVIKKFGL